MFPSCTGEARVEFQLGEEGGWSREEEKPGDNLIVTKAPSFLNLQGDEPPAFILKRFRHPSTNAVKLESQQ